MDPRVVLEDHRAKIRIGVEDIMALLGLPEGVHIRAIDKENDPVGFVIHVYGEALPPVDPNVSSPEWAGRMLTATTFVDRKPYRRWDWRLSELSEF